MKIEDFKTLLSDCCTDITVSYNGLNCGIFPTVQNSEPTYSVWFGEIETILHNVEDVMASPIFAGKTLNDIFSEIEIREY